MNMKNKKLIWAAMPLALALLLAACGQRPAPTPSSSSESETTESSETGSSETGSSEESSESSESSESTESSESSEESSESSESSSESEEIEHRAGYVKGLPDNAVLRVYDEEFDTMIDDFSSETLNGETTGTVHNGYLSAVVDSEDANFPANIDKAIYKQAAENFGPATAITFTMRVVEGKLPLENLILAMRPTDNVDAHVYPIRLSEALDDEGEPLPALTNEFQDFNVSLLNTLEEGTEVFPGTSLPVISENLGFHLYADGTKEVSAVLEIKKITRVKGSATADVDTFARNDFSKPNDMGSWWCDSASGYIVRKGLELKGKSYTTPALTTEQKAETQLVLNINGDTSGTKIVPVKGSADGTAVAWADLKDKDGNAVVAAASGFYGPLAIDLEKSGLKGEDVTAYRIESTTKIELVQVFLSSFGVPEETPIAPVLDTANAVVYDNFNRERTSAQVPTDWAEDVEGDLNGWVSYSNKGALSMDGENLVFAPKGEAGYTELTLGTKHHVEDHRYLVFEIKGSADDVDTFRVEINNRTAIWLNSSLAAKGLTSKEATASYPTEDGYKWYVIDLTQHEEHMENLINIYASNTETLYVKSIFVADDRNDMYEVADGNIKTPSLPDLVNYAEIADAQKVTSRFLRLDLTLDEVRADSIRVQVGDKTKWFHDADKLIARRGDTGALITADDILDGDVTMLIDLAENEFTLDGTAKLIVHAGGGFTGGLTLTAVKLLNAGWTSAFNIGGASEVALTPSGPYAYGGKIFIQHEGAKALRMKVAGDGTTTLGSYRFEIDGMSAINNGKLIATRDDGTVVGADDIIPTAGEFVTLTLKSGEAFPTGGIESHFGDESMNGHTLSLSNFNAVYEHAPYTVVVNSYSDIL